jgi:WD40 repeat protein
MVWPIPNEGGAFLGAFSPDGRTYAAVCSHRGQMSGLENATIELIDTAGGRPLRSLPTRDVGGYSVAFSADGRQVRLVSGRGGSNDGEVVVYDATTGREVSSHRFSVPGPLGGSAVSPDGRLMARAAHGGGSVTLWDLEADREDATLFSTLVGPTVSSVGFSRDGGTLGVGRSDGSIELWDLQTRRVRAVLRGHRPGAYESADLRFSPDGATLASRGAPAKPLTFTQILSRAISRLRGGRPWQEDFEVVVLDVTSGRPLCRADRVIHPFYSPDGRTLAVRCVDLSARLYDVPKVRTGAR